MPYPRASARTVRTLLVMRPPARSDARISETGAGTAEAQKWKYPTAEIGVGASPALFWIDVIPYSVHA